MKSSIRWAIDKDDDILVFGFDKPRSSSCFDKLAKWFPKSENIDKDDSYEGYSISSFPRRWMKNKLTFIVDAYLSPSDRLKDLKDIGGRETR